MNHYYRDKDSLSLSSPPHTQTNLTEERERMENISRQRSSDLAQVGHVGQPEVDLIKGQPRHIREGKQQEKCGCAFSFALRPLTSVTQGIDFLGQQCYIYL